MTLQAQVTTADVIGTVKDSSGSAVANATVAITNLGTNISQTAPTNASGEYVFTLLPIGRYTLRVEAPGFKAFTMSDVGLGPGDRVRLDATLEVGGTQQSVEVVGQAPALKTDSSTMATTVSETAMRELPTNGRSFTTFAQLVPGGTAGVPSQDINSGARPDDRRPSSSFAINGQYSMTNSYLIDGMDNNDKAIGTIVVRPSMEGIAEFQIQTNLYTAEVGRVAGGVASVITKSGTNEFHGSLFEYLQNDAADARNFFSATKAEFRQNQFGGSLGGPIKRNKTFFFGDFEGSRMRQGQPASGTLPTAAEKIGNFSGVAKIFDPLSTIPDPNNPGKYTRTEFPNDQIPLSRIDPIAVNYLGLYPDPNLPGLANNYTSGFVKSQDYSTLDTRIDHHFSDKDWIYGRYSFNDTTTFSPSNLPLVNGIIAGGSLTYPGWAYQRAQGVQLNHVHVFNPNLLLELAAGYSRYASQTLNANYGNAVSEQFGLAGANIDAQSSGLTLFSPSGYDPLGDSAWLPIIQIDNNFQYMGSITWIHGSHKVKAGAALVRRQITLLQSGQARGQFTFDANATNDPSGNTPSSGNSIASMLLGIPSSGQRNLNPVWPGYRSWEPSVYIQDDWNVNSRLTLNLGIRYSVFTPLTEVANRASNLDMNTYKIVQAGVNGTSNTVGVNTDYSNVAPRVGLALRLGHGMVLRGGAGLTYFYNCYGSPCVFKNAPFLGSYSFTNSTTMPTQRIDSGFPPYVAQDPNNPAGTIWAVAGDSRSGYVEQASLSLQKEIRGSVISVGYVGAQTRHMAAAPNIDVPLPGPGDIQSRRPYYSVLPGITSLYYDGSFQNASYHSMPITFEHRYGKGLTLSANYTWSHSLILGSSPASAFSPQVENNWSLEYGNSLYDVRHRWAILATYEIPLGSHLNGFAKTLVAGWQLNGIAVWQTGFPFGITNNTPRANTGSGDRPNRIADGTSSDPTLQAWFNTSAFVAQPLYTAGNAGVNFLYGPHQQHVDLSLAKQFAITERWRLQFRAEAFNIANTASFSNPNGALGSAAFGTISSTALPPRQLQFVLRLRF